ncbi:MAG: hypothetical protein HC800_03050 [Phormidesmis sp. RL_2_1]|nr:hypothetical protein [Phormidesmis sp. RL_2_1]
MPKLLLSLLAITVVAALVTFWPHQTTISQLIPSQSDTAPDTATDTAPDTAPDTVTASGSDQLAHPPVYQAFTAGPYKLVIHAKDDWQTPAVSSQFYENEILRWQKDLPHQYGPRFALVSPQGQVLLLDEFINVASPHALTLINADGQTIVRYSFDDIKAALAVSAADLTRQATSGWWITTPPLLDLAHDLALISTGGTTLAVDLTTGELNCRRDLLSSR